MCDPASFAAMTAAFSGAGATATGATAAAGAAGAASAGMSVGSALAMAGTAISAIGSISQGIAANKSAKQQARAIGEQMAQEKQFTAVEDTRRRAQFRSQIAQQRAELAARGVSLDSATSMMLGQAAAQEMSFDSQSVRSGGAARQTELSYSRQAALAEGQNGLLKGVFSAAGGVLSSAQDLWPGLSSKRVLS